MLKKLFVACLCVAGLRADYDLKMDVEFTANTDDSVEISKHVFALNYSVALPEVSPDGSWRVQAELISSKWKIEDDEDEMILSLEEFEPVKQIDFVLDKNWKLKRPNTSKSPVFDALVGQALRFFLTKEYEFRNDLDEDVDDFPEPNESSIRARSDRCEGKFHYDDTVGFGNAAFLAKLKGLTGEYEIHYGDQKKFSYEFTGSAKARLIVRSNYPHEAITFFEETREVPCIAKVKMILLPH